MKETCFRSLLPGVLLLWAFGLKAAERTLAFVTEPFPPFSYEAPGSSAGAGPMAEVVQAVCARLQIRCSIEVFPWRRALRMAENGSVDGIFSVLKNPEREAAFYVSDMVVDTSYGFYVAETSPFRYRQPVELKGMTIGVYGPSGTSAALEDILDPALGNRVVVEVANANVLRKLATGRYGDEHRVLAAINLDVGKDLVAKEGITGIRPAGVFKKISYGIGLSRRKVSEEQFREFNAALRQLIRQGKVRDILRRHGLQPAS